MKKIFTILIFIILLGLVGCNKTQVTNEKIAQNELENMADKDPQDLLPEKCSFPSGLKCEDYSVNSNTINLELKNDLSSDIIIQKIIAHSQDKPTLECIWESEQELLNKDSNNFVLAGNNCINEKNTGSKFNLEVTYYSSNTGPEFGHKIDGELSAKIQE